MKNVAIYVDDDENTRSQLIDIFHAMGFSWYIESSDSFRNGEGRYVKLYMAQKTMALLTTATFSRECDCYYVDADILAKNSENILSVFLGMKQPFSSLFEEVSWNDM